MHGPADFFFYLFSHGAGGEDIYPCSQPHQDAGEEKYQHGGASHRAHGERAGETAEDSDIRDVEENLQKVGQNQGYAKTDDAAPEISPGEILYGRSHVPFNSFGCGFAWECVRGILREITDIIIRFSGFVNMINGA